MSAVPAHVPLVVQTRGVGSAQSVETVHYGSIAVVDAEGRLLWAAGDAQAKTFTRSTLKPFQALPFVEEGGPAALGYTEEEVALLCASHSGLDRHVALAAAMLDHAGCTEAHLQCGCHAPLHYPASQIPTDVTWNQLHNNCSGKHAGFLGWCRLHGAPLDSYCDETHPLQRAIRARVAQLAGIEDARIAVGIDGCSAPNLALPLASIARLYALLAAPERVADAAATVGGASAARVSAATALATLADAMARHPEIVSGPGRGDAALSAAFAPMAATARAAAGAVNAGDATVAAPSRLIAKGGAGGLQLLALREHGLGIAVRISDGNNAALMCATVAVLDVIGALDADRRAALAPFGRTPIVNLRGIVTGEMRALPALARVG